MASCLTTKLTFRHGLVITCCNKVASKSIDFYWGLIRLEVLALIFFVRLVF